MKKLLPIFILILGISVYSQKPEKPGASTKSKTEPIKSLPSSDSIKKSSEVTKSCDLKLKDAPVLRGLSLGMTKLDLQNMFKFADDYFVYPVEKRDYKIGLLESASIFFDRHAVSARLNETPVDFFGVKSLSVKLLDEKVYFLELSYSENEVKFDSAEQFAKTLSEKFKLPFSDWKYSISSAGSINCGEFRVDVSSISNEITIADLLGENEIEKRKEKRRQEFKP